MTRIEARDSVLVVIDVQGAFVGKVPPDEAHAIVMRTAWLVGAAGWLDIPAVVTAEDLPRLGGPVDEVARLPPGTVIHNEVIFDLTGEPGIVRAIPDTGRRTAVLVGFETDVCVALIAWRAPTAHVRRLIETSFATVECRNARRRGPPRATTGPPRCGRPPGL